MRISHKLRQMIERESKSKINLPSRVYCGNIRYSGDTVKWEAYSRESGWWFHGYDTMSECVKFGIELQKEAWNVISVHSAKKII